MDKKSLTITISVSEAIHEVLRKLAKENYRTIKAQTEMLLVERLDQLVKKNESQ